jgi:hypothetical protein
MYIQNPTVEILVGLIGAVGEHHQIKLSQLACIYDSCDVGINHDYLLGTQLFPSFLCR